MSMSAVDHDPLSLSHQSAHGGGGEKHNLHGLGILSDTHLDKQPANSSSSVGGIPSSQQQPQEIVKVQFVQSGGKVVPLKQGSTRDSFLLDSGDSNNNTKPQSTPRKAKKTLGNLLGFHKTPKKSRKSSVMSKGSTLSASISKRYQTFGDEDDDEDDKSDDDDAAQSTADDSTSPSSVHPDEREFASNNKEWDKVDAAIPVLQL